MNKELLLIILCLFLLNNSFAQDFFSKTDTEVSEFANSETNYLNTEHRWYMMETSFLDYSSSIEFFSDELVEIDGKEYRKLMKSYRRDGSFPTVKGYFREDAQKVYRYSDNTQDKSEHVYMDFAVEVGDTIMLKNHEYYVSKKDTFELLDGSRHELIEAKCTQFYGNLRYARGFGFIGSQISSCHSIVDGSYGVKCYEKNGEQLYYDEGPLEFTYEGCWFEREPYLPIIKDDKVWYMTEASFPSALYVHAQYSYTQDSFLMENGKYYRKKMVIYPNVSEVFERGFFREENGIIYQYEYGKENIVIDMNLQVNDTFTVKDEDITTLLKVTAIEGIFMGGIHRKRITLKCENREYYWLEGIGVLTEDGYCKIDGYSHTINCVFEGDDPIYKFKLGNECLFVNTQEVEQDNIVIYPNPATNHVLISDHLPKTTRYEIYTLQGQTILKGELNGNRIELPDYYKGLLFIRLISDKDEIIKKIIKI